MKIRTGDYEMHDSEKCQPEPGELVLVLSDGGVLIRHVWRELDQYLYDAWIEFPKIPDAVKVRRLNRTRRGSK